ARRDPASAGVRYVDRRAYAVVIPREGGVSSTHQSFRCLLDRPPSRAMTVEEVVPKNSDHLDAYIDATAQVLGLAVKPEWKPAVRANLEATFKLAALVAEK